MESLGIVPDRSRLAGGILLGLAVSAAWAQPRLLVFSGANPSSYRHDGIDWSLKLMKSLAPMGGFVYDTASSATVFTDANLKKYQAVFMNGGCKASSLFNTAQREALAGFIHGGGGWAGNHCAAAQVLNEWPWYQQLVGAIHLQHTPGSMPGVLKVEDRTHISMRHFTSNTWNIAKEELYYFRNAPAPSWRPNPQLPKVTVLLTFQSWSNNGVVQTKPDGNKGDSSHMGGLAWYHEFEGGRSWYTGIGHEQDFYSKDSLYIKHLLGGLKYVLKLDGTSGVADRNRLNMDGNGPKAFMGADMGNPESIASRARWMRGYRVFDIKGNRLRETDLGSGRGCEASPAMMRIGMRND
jgi:type 1 glutamine amidotransferase